MVNVEIIDGTQRLLDLNDELFKSKYPDLYSKFNSDEQNAYDLQYDMPDGDDIFNYSNKKDVVSIKLSSSETVMINNLDIYEWYQSDYYEFLWVWADDSNFVYFCLYPCVHQAGSLGIWSIDKRDWVFTRRDECFCVEAVVYDKQLDLFVGSYYWHYPMVDNSGEGFFLIDKNRKYRELKTEKIYSCYEKTNESSEMLDNYSPDINIDLRMPTELHDTFVVDIKQKLILFYDRPDKKIVSAYKFSMLDIVWKGKPITVNDLVECGETQLKLGLDNYPKQIQSYNALNDLIEHILNPVAQYFGDIQLTYGFCSLELSKHIDSRIYPKLDQHSACELNSKGDLICERKGAACDFYIKEVSSLTIAKWIVANTEFDRLYFYGDELPIHVSYGQENTRQIVTMNPGKSGKLIPKTVKKL